MTDAALRVEGLGKRHPGTEESALAEVDLEVHAGRVLVLLGHSGAGKTTLLRIVAGLETADAGRVWVSGRLVADPASVVDPERRGVGLVFQHLELWPHMTVAENIAFGLPGRPRGRAARRHPVVASLAGRVGIADLLGRAPATLSGGERQRVAIARTLAPRPPVVLYDEPLANLDPDRRGDLRRLIRALASEDEATVVYVTHDADEAMAMGDDVAVLHHGRIVERGAPQDLYLRPATLAGARALGPVTALPGEVTAGRVRTSLGELETGRVVATPRCVAVLRPEEVEVGPEGVPAEVVDAHPVGAAWRVRARVDGEVVEGHASSRVEPGASVHLAVRGPAWTLEAEEP